MVRKPLFMKSLKKISSNHQLSCSDQTGLFVFKPNKRGLAILGQEKKLEDAMRKMNDLGPFNGSTKNKNEFVQKSDKGKRK